VATGRGRTPRRDGGTVACRCRLGFRSLLGHQRREHEDLEIAVPTARFGEVVDALADVELWVVGPDPALADRSSGHPWIAGALDTPA
jgi:hypothetical protein